MIEPSQQGEAEGEQQDAEELSTLAGVPAETAQAPTESTPQIAEVARPDEPAAAPQGDGTAEQQSPPPQAFELAAVAATLVSLEEQLGESQRLLARQSDLVDKLHAENQRLRIGELRAATLPLVRDLLRLHDDIGRLATDREEAEDLDVVKVSLLDALARNGITTFQPAPGEQFDPKQHSIVGILRAEDASRDRTVAEVIRVGVQWEDGQAIRVADVRVYKHAPTAETTGPVDQPSQTN